MGIIQTFPFTLPGRSAPACSKSGNLREGLLQQEVRIRIRPSQRKPPGAEAVYLEGPSRLLSPPPSLCRGFLQPPRRSFFPPLRLPPGGGCFLSWALVLRLRLGLSPPPLAGCPPSAAASPRRPLRPPPLPGAAAAPLPVQRSQPAGRPLPAAPAPAMGRRRRPREPPARLLLLALALASGSALLLASLSLLLAAWPRSGARAALQQEAAAAATPQELLSEDDVEELDPVVLSAGWSSQGKLLHHFAQQGALRQRRHATKRKPRRPSPVSAAHYEVQPAEGRTGIQADTNGTIRGWAEAKLNTSSPLRYDSGRGEFTVVKRGLYYLYCQVHFNERNIGYMKLDVMLDGQRALRCLEQFPTTSSSNREAELRVCQVSGLLMLRPGESIRLQTIAEVQLKADRYFTFFGLFQGPQMSAPAAGGPRAPSRWRQGSPPRQSSLEAAVWVAGGALGAGFVACLLLALAVQCRLGSLREELAQLREELKMSRAPADQGPSKPHQRAGDLLVPIALRGKHPMYLERRKRDVKKTPCERSQKRRRQSVLHMVPDRHSNNDEGDATEIWWKPSLRQGQALEPSGRDVLVKHTGLYFVYSQVLFHDPTFTMGQVVQRQAPGKPGQILFRCVQNMPANPDHAYNSCYSGGIFHLQQGDRLNLCIPRFNASFDTSPHGTFLGLLRL
ncbi:tumor necrosis factor ligand superfamily member 12 [Hemicordylus capensis]|uniref:tumor necrosis factor ligand superfamily member 12 n=1 Tax=Hemicordylus capensis TaxID=884348 RepID=UPI002302F9F0|nr:tumor necrosis factor ligand superfamily member 12 [Hemicordylus capensis]